MRSWQGWIAAALAAGVCGCGGGGGGGGGSDTGLIPDPPALGAVLHADAATLRPLRDGAVYRYRGVATPYLGATPSNYITDTTQSAQAGGGVLESSTNFAGGGPVTNPVTAAAGVVSSRETFNFTGTDEVVTVIELRSPVRTGDQYTILERHFSNIGDVDGDGRADSLDIAIYARVIGNSTLALPNLPSVEAVEVDTFVVARIKGSSGQSAVAQAIQKTWYAPGIGVVRRVFDVPNSSDTDRGLTDETIVFWDGLTEGLGALAPQAAIVPASGGALAGTALLGGFNIYAQFAFADHALLVTQGEDLFAGTIFSTLDLRGAVTAARIYPGFRRSGSADRFVAYAGGVVHLATPNGDAISLLTRFDANGVLQGSIGGTPLDLGGGRFLPFVDRLEAVGDGTTIWVQWLRRYSSSGVGFQMELVLRGFDAQGVAVTPEMLLEGPSSAGPFAMGGVTAKGGRALAWWRGSDGVTHEERYAIVTPQDTAHGVRRLVTGLPTPNFFSVGLLLDAGGAFVWSIPFSGSGTLPSSAGVRLDGAYAPLRSTSGSIDTELLANTPLFNFNQAFPQTVGQRIILTGSLTDALYLGTSFPEPLDVVATLSAGASPLASVPARVTRTAPGFMVGLAQAQLAFPDRVLLLGSGFRLSTTVVFLR